MANCLCLELSSIGLRFTLVVVVNGFLLVRGGIVPLKSYKKRSTSFLFLYLYLLLLLEGLGVLLKV